MGFRNGDNAPMAYMELTERAMPVEEVAAPVPAAAAPAEDVKAE